MDQRVDEVLEALWTEFESRGIDPNAKVRISEWEHSDTTAVDEAVARGFIVCHKDEVGFSDDGRRTACALTRRHRLAERLFSDVLDLDTDEVERGACKFEHVLSSAATDSICILLGHPRTCPHGKPIPTGECCDLRTEGTRPLVLPLARLEHGERGVISYVGTRDPQRLAQLTSLGVLTDRPIEVKQRRPTFVVRIDETDVALDALTAKEIFVRPESRRSQQRRRFGRR